MGISIRTHRWRYTEWGEGGRFGNELYDYQSDPAEFTNLAVQPDKKMNTLIRGLQQMLHQKASAATPVTPFNPKRL